MGGSLSSLRDKEGFDVLVLLWVAFARGPLAVPSTEASFSCVLSSFECCLSSGGHSGLVLLFGSRLLIGVKVMGSLLDGSSNVLWEGADLPGEGEKGAIGSSDRQGGAPVSLPS